MSASAADGPRLDPAAPPVPPGMTRGTLARRLVLQVVALVALVAIALSAVTTFAVFGLLVTRIDQDNNAATGQVLRFGVNSSDGRGPGLQRNTIVFGYKTTQGDVGYIIGQGSTTPLDGSLISQIGRTVPEPTRGTTMSIGSYGRYRVQVSQVGQTTLLVGTPMESVNGVLAKLIGLEAVLTLLAMGGAALGARALIGNSLRPLNRLQNTANQVSRLELDRGDVDLSVRVPPEDTDPRSEVGQVGIAFNHMLGNVAGALAVRQSSERKLSQFVADASHELRNPLAAIRGYAELTRRSRSELPPDTSFAMARVESEADRMSHLVEDLLLLARLDSGPNLEVGPTDLTETVLNATSDARAAGPDHRWTLSLTPEPVVVEADRHRIHQIVANLLANARTHTPPGTTVEAGVRVEGSEAVIFVTDNGPGIPPEIGASVFERFTRADTSRARADGHQGSGSTGLGLAIVAAVVDAHRGRVWVDSVPGRTQFMVALPLHQATMPAPDDHGPHEPRP